MTSLNSAGDYGRLHNFYAGPAVLPLQVVEEIRAALPNFAGSGAGLMEISHRSAPFGALVDSAKARLRRVLGIPDDYTVLFLQGGASTQFYMVPLNLLQGGSADYVDTGSWSAKAVKEADRCGTARVVWSGAEDGYVQCPALWTGSPGRVYTHYTSNNTVRGTQFPDIPAVDGLLVCDASSDVASRRMDYDKIDLLYAGAQKNLGPSGVTLVVLSPRAMARCEAAADEPPTMLSYRVHAGKSSLFNTPNTLGIFALERVLAWIEERGLGAVQADNDRKSELIYGLLDGSDFWRPCALAGSRSQMNVTWRLADADLEPVLVEQATAAGFIGLKGHRSVGGLRASMYNALPVASVEALVDFLRDFERRLG